MAYNNLRKKAQGLSVRIGPSAFMVVIPLSFPYPWLDMDKKQQTPTAKDKNLILRVVATGVFFLLLLVLFFVASVRLLGDEGRVKLTEALSSRYGLWGIFFYIFFTEAFMTPFPNNICFALATDMDPLLAISVMSTASVLGCSTAYFYGRVLDKIPFVRRQSEKILQKWGYHINKYSYFLILAAGLIPMPFTTICVAAGIIQLDPRKTLPCILIRAVRTILYIYAFRLGILFLG